MLSPESFDSFESDAEKSLDEEDLSASFLSCAVSPSPSSIFSNEENRNNETVITNEAMLYQDVDKTVEPNRSVQVRVFENF